MHTLDLTEPHRRFHAHGHRTSTKHRILLVALVALGSAGCARGEESMQQDDRTATPDSAAVVVTDAPVPRPEPATGPDGAPLLTAHGWGPLRIGMTRAEVVAAAGEDANPEAVGGPEPEACDQWQPTDAPAGMLVMVERDTLTRITVMRDAEVKTPAGVGLGAPASAVLDAHGNEAEVTPHKYLSDPASYITVWESGAEPGAPESRGLVYEVGMEGTVTQIHAGGPSIQYVEGCL